MNRKYSNEDNYEIISLQSNDNNKNTTHPESNRTIKKSPSSSPSLMMTTDRSRRNKIITSEQIQQIKSYADIITVIQSYQLPHFHIHSDKTRATALCPFHSDTNPSLQIDSKKGIFKCFACGAGGDIFQFVREYHNHHPHSSGDSNRIMTQKMSYPQAIQYIVQNFTPSDFQASLGSSPNAATSTSSSYFFSSQLQSPNRPAKHDTSPQNTTQRQNRMTVANTIAANFFAQMLYNDTLPWAGKARSYLRQRNMDPQTVRSFALGYAPDVYSFSSFSKQQPQTTIAMTTNSNPKHDKRHSSFSSSSSSSAWGEGSLVERLYSQYDFTPREIVESGLGIVTSQARKRFQLQMEKQQQLVLQRKKQDTKETVMMMKNEVDLPSSHIIENHNISQPMRRGYVVNEQENENMNILSTLKITDIMDRFRGRIMFPIFDTTGVNIIGFGGRLLTSTTVNETQIGSENEEVDHNINFHEELKNYSTNRNFTYLNQKGLTINSSTSAKSAIFKSAKYINSPESIIFHKKHVLFGLHIANAFLDPTVSKQQEYSKLRFDSAQIYERDGSLSIVIVEGYFDAIALHAAGIHEVVASMGTSLSLEQLSLAATVLNKISSNGRIVLCLDGDLAGINAVRRLCDGSSLFNFIKMYSVDVLVALLPANIKDPAEYIESKRAMGIHSAGTLFRKEVLDSALPWQDWYIKHLVDQYESNNTDSVSTICTNIASFLSLVDDTKDQKRRAHEAAEILVKAIVQHSGVEFPITLLTRIERDIIDMLSRNEIAKEALTRIVEASDGDTSERSGLSKMERLFSGEGISLAKNELTNSTSLRSDKYTEMYDTNNEQSGAKRVMTKAKQNGGQSLRSNIDKSGYESPLLEHFSGFSFHPFDASWLGIDHNEQRANLILGGERTFERKFMAYTQRKYSSAVYFNSNAYLGRKFITKEAVAAGYNGFVSRDGTMLDFGSSHLLLQNGEHMLDAAEKQLLRIMIIHPQARQALKLAFMEKNQPSLEWTSFDREWLFQSLIGAPGRESLPKELQEGATTKQLRDYLASRPDVPPGSFSDYAETRYAEQMIDDVDESNASDARNILDQSFLETSKVNFTMNYEPSVSPDGYSDHRSSQMVVQKRAMPRNGVGSLDFFFTEELLPSLFTEKSVSRETNELTVQETLTFIMKAKEVKSMQLLKAQWRRANDVLIARRFGSDSNNFTEPIWDSLSDDELTKVCSELCKKVALAMKTVHEMTQVSKSLGGKLLDYSSSNNSEGKLCVHKQQELAKMIDDFVDSLPEDTHRPEPFDGSYVFGSDTFDGDIDTRFSGRSVLQDKTTTKKNIDWEAVSFNFDSILE